MPAGQDERVPNVRQTHHALGAVVANLVIGDLREGELLGGWRQAEGLAIFAEMFTFDSWLLYLFSIP